MFRMTCRRTRLLALLALILPTLPAAAGAVETPALAKGGIHIVRPGDTLEQLAEIYLGSARRWLEIARLNPGLGDPKRLPPGRRLHVLPTGGGTFAAARIDRLSNQVDERPVPQDWSQAQENDFLVEQDGVRTHPKSSAEMRFGDGTRLTVTEDSLVFLRRSGDRLKGVPGRSVEIVEGQAEVASDPARAAAHPPEIEIVLGKTRATSRPNRAGVAQARARRPGEGGAKVMVYGGEGEVEAAGSKVALAEGMGTSVGKEGPPAPPEKLLPAPQLTGPLPGTKMGYANPVFTWAAVPEAAAYVLELCADARCGALLDRVVVEAKDGQPQWRSQALPVRTLYWRVTARSRSGLDGYPAEPGGLEILSNQLDHEPPTAKLALSGRQIEVAGRLFAAPGFGVEVTAEDAGCGLLEASPAIDGSPETPGEHRVGGYALDRCGNRFEAPPLTLIVDAEAPTVRTAIVERAVFEQDGEPKATRRSSRRAGAPAGTGLYWSSDGRRWLPLWRPKASGRPDTPAKGEEKDGDEIVSGKPRLFLEARGVKLSIDGQTVAPGDGQLLTVTAEDAGAGVERLRFHTANSGQGGAPVLELEAVDLVGNSRQIAWPLVLP